MIRPLSRRRTGPARCGGRASPPRSPSTSRTARALARWSYATRCCLERALAVHQRIGGAVIAVERHPDAARVHELRSARTRAPEGQVRVAEHEPRRRRARHQLGVGVRRLGQEAPHVRGRRAVHVEHLSGAHALGQPGELVGHGVAQELPAARDRRAGGFGGLFRRSRPAVDVAADPACLEAAEPLDGLRRPGSEERVIAAEHEALRPLRAGVMEHRVEGGQVAVNVVEHGEHALEATRPDVRCFALPRIGTL